MDILVADDSKTNLALISAALEKLGHTVVPATSGQQAIDLYTEKRPDLVILDVVMEGMDGFDCAKQLRQQDDENWIPIIFLSGSVDDESIAKGINAGGDDYLTKPFSEITLSAKILAMQRISEMRKKLFKTTQELMVLSSTDPLTGLYNRFQFEKSLQERIAGADRHNILLALLFIDIDHFKSINDTLGHHVGDLLLREIARRLKACLRMEDIIARIGGDEFVILLNNLENTAIASQIADKIISSISEPYYIEENHIRVGASVGIACYPYPTITAQNFQQSADIAMYHAKESGRNNFQFYNEELNVKYKKQITLEHELRFALERNELFINYQPIYNILNKKIIGMEALLRWQHPEFGDVSPNVFIVIAEETGCMLEIGNWVLDQVCLQGAKWIANGLKDFKLSVNLSLQQVIHENFFSHLIQTIEQTKMNPKFLELELTETTVITYTDHLKGTLKKIYDLGISISIDDFGTRYSSLTSLKYLPITTLKIDKSFLKDVLTDNKNSIIVKSLIALGNNLNLNVVAEGIQTEEQLQFLIINGCLLGQGFFLSQAINPIELESLLVTQSKTRTQLS